MLLFTTGLRSCLQNYDTHNCEILLRVLVLRHVVSSEDLRNIRHGILNIAFEAIYVYKEKRHLNRITHFIII